MTDEKFRKLKELLTQYRTEQDKERPYFQFNRDVMWNKEPCFFCGSKLSPQKSGERYFHAEGIKGEEEPDYIIQFCGKCLEDLEKMFETDMG